MKIEIKIKNVLLKSTQRLATKYLIIDEGGEEHTYDYEKPLHEVLHSHFCKANTSDFATVKVLGVHFTTFPIITAKLLQFE